MKSIKNFRKEIYEFIRNNRQIFDGCAMPFEVNMFFFVEANNGTITAKQLEIEYRLSSLLSSLISCVGEEDATKHCLKYIPRSYHYKDECVSIDIDRTKDQINLNLTYGDYYLRTNAFVFNKKSGYYFDCYWKVDTVVRKDAQLMGKIIELHTKV